MSLANTFRGILFYATRNEADFGGVDPQAVPRNPQRVPSQAIKGSILHLRGLLSGASGYFLHPRRSKSATLGYLEPPQRPARDLREPELDP